jgi:hypothetical protein
MRDARRIGMAPILSPPGWGFNPSARRYRMRAVAVCCIGLVLATACLLHTRGFIDRLWEPLPMIDDDGWILPPLRAPWPSLDLVGFAVVLVLTSIGGADRWRTRPRTVIAAGVAAALTVATTLLGWGLQFAIAGTTSSLFFLTAAAAIATLAILEDEVYAAVVHLRRDRFEPGSDDLPYVSMTGEPIGRRGPPAIDYAAGIGAMLVGAAMLMASNGVALRSAAHARFLGGLVVAIGALSLAQVARPLRWVNAAIGVWLVVAPLLHGYMVRDTIFSTIFGMMLLAVSTVANAPAEAADGATRSRRGS